MTDNQFKFGYEDDIFIISLEQLGRIVSRRDFKDDPVQYLVRHELETTETWHDEEDLYK